VVHAALAQIERILRRDEETMFARFEEQPALRSAFDTALTGCAMLYACLQAEVEELHVALANDGSTGVEDEV
jgi:hypothetical protein